MKFNQVVFKNFTSFQSEKLENINHKELTLIEVKDLDDRGSNGAGKSTVWNTDPEAAVEEKVLK
jgi:DNA repair exonuclease SbcCD ATPase subunit